MLTTKFKTAHTLHYTTHKFMCVGIYMTLASIIIKLHRHLIIKAVKIDGSPLLLSIIHKL